MPLSPLGGGTDKDIEWVLMVATSCIVVSLKINTGGCSAASEIFSCLGSLPPPGILIGGSGQPSLYEQHRFLCGFVLDPGDRKQRKHYYAI